MALSVLLKRSLLSSPSFLGFPIVCRKYDSPLKYLTTCIALASAERSQTSPNSCIFKHNLGQRRSPSRHSHSPSKRSRSPGRHSFSPGRHSFSPGRHSFSPGRRSRSPGRRSRSPGRRSRSPGRRSTSRHSESSVEQGLRITVGNDRYGVDTPERRRLSDRLGSPVDSLSDVDRDDLADGPIFSRGLSHPRSPERYPSHEESPSSPFSMRHDEDYRNRDIFLHQSDYGMKYDNLQDLSRERDRDGEVLRKSLYSSEERGREIKRPRYDRDDRLLDVSIDPQGFLPGTRNYRKRSRSPSPTYLDEDFRELESARRKREKEEQSRNLSRELTGSGCVIPGLTNPVQSPEPRYLYRPDEAPAMPKKSILKKRVDDSSVQPEVFPCSSASVKEPALSSHPSLPQRSCITPFSSEVENFLKQFNKNAVAESASTESQGNVCDWRPYSGLQQNTFPGEQNFESFLKQKECNESTSEPVDRHSDFLLPHERASQDGSGFSRILGMMADSTSTQEKRRRSFPDIEDEEKFLYGDDEDDSLSTQNISSPPSQKINSPSIQKLTMTSVKEPLSQKVSSPSSPTPSVKPDTSEEFRPEYEKIHDLLKTIGLDIGVAEIGKLAARTQERLHGKKRSRSPDRHSVVSRKTDSRELRRSRSDTRSPESSQKRSLSPSGSYPSSKDTSSVSKSERIKSKTVGQDNSADTPERSVPSVSLIPSAPPSLPNLPPTSVSQYSVSRFSPFTTTQLPQNYPTPTMPPSGYDAYRHYIAYAASGWPMYAPPQQAEPALSDVQGLVTLTMPPNSKRPNLRVIETVSTEKIPVVDSFHRQAPESKKEDSVHMQIPTITAYSRLPPQHPQPSFKSSTERISDEKNRASQKQKVIEEREKLKAEQEARQKKLQYLKTELDRLSKQQGEMLRKKRREKDGHKDPLLVEVNRLQENIVKEIAQLQTNAEAAEKKQSELDKVAQILGINIFEKSRKQSTENKDTSEKNKSENAKSQEKTSSSIKEPKTSNDKPKGKSPKPTESLQPSKQHFQLANIYDYYDTGNHWCKDCNATCGTMFDFFTHMHNKKHRQTLDPYNRPWATKTQTEAKQDLMKRTDKIPLPAKGSEFLIPVTGYFCQLCHEFFGDQISAEQHVKSHSHNEKYKKHMDENPLYEERRNLDHQAGLSVIQETERRLKRKQCEKQKEERDEKTAKVTRKEEPKGTKELEEVGNENEISKKKENSNGQKFGVKLKLKKDGNEAEKNEEKKEEPQKESKQSSFGKFSWRKTEKEEKNQSKDVAVSKEESAEEGTEKESKSQSGKSNSKPIAIKLSGKTVIPHTSPWTPVVTTSSQAKIRPNLPVPIMVLRKNATATVSKPAPLNTFLSIKSSGATTKPLPVVKESNPELVLPPDIISKAFGGEVVVLKSSQENTKMPEQAEGQEDKSLARTLEHAKAVELAKASAAKTQEQAVTVAKAQVKAQELATMAKEQEVTRTAKTNEQTQLFERSSCCTPVLPLPPGLPLSLAPPVPRPFSVLFPPPPPLPSPKPVAILADDMAPGVSEVDKNILTLAMCPRPLPPPTVFRDQAKKLEKKNPCLAAGNAKDLYGIFYNSIGRSASSAALAKFSFKLSPAERERSTDMLSDSKSSSSSSTQESLENIGNSSGVREIALGNKTPETEAIKVFTACEENVEIDSSAERECCTLTNKEMADKLPTNTSVSIQNVVEMGDPTEFGNNPSGLAPQLPESSALPFDEVSKRSSELDKAEFKPSDDGELLESSVAPLEYLTKKPLELEFSAMPLSESNSAAAHLDEISKTPSELDSAEFKSADDKKLPIQLSKDYVSPLKDIKKNSAELELGELAVYVPESSALPLDEVCKDSLEVETADIKSHDENKLLIKLPEDSVALLEEVSRNPSELETAEFKSPEDKELAMQLPEDDFSKRVSVTGVEDISHVPQNQQKMEMHDKSKLKESQSDVEMKEYMTGLDERDVKGEHLELGHHFAISQRDTKSQLLEMQIETHKGRGPTLTEEKQSDDSSELPISTCVSEMCVQSQPTLEPIDLSKMKEENPQVVMTVCSCSKDSPLDLKVESVGFDGLKSAISDEVPPTSEVQSIDPELRPLNNGELGSFHINNKEQEVFVNSQPKGGGDFDVCVPEPGKMPNKCLANVTVLSSILEREISQQTSSCETKDLQVQGTEDLGEISSTIDVEPSTRVELMFIKNGTQGPSESDKEQSYIEKRVSLDKDNINFSSAHPEIVQEPLDALPTEFSVGHLEEENLNFTSMNTGDLNTSEAGDFDLNTTYSELNFDQSATLTLNLNVENERDSPKSDQVTPSDPSTLKADLVLETIDFSLGDIEVERGHLGILPSEILNEDIVESPKLETIAPICLNSKKVSEVDIDQPGVEPEIIDFDALTSRDQEDKLCSLVSDVVSPASNGGTAETGMPLLEIQDMSIVSEVLLQGDDIRGGTSDMPSLSCSGKNVQSQAPECLESFLPNPKEIYVEMGGSGDSELYVVKNEMQTSAGDITKSEVEGNDGRCEVNSKRASDEIRSSAEHLVSSYKIDPSV
ncbi:zinc finger protein 318 isoform X2 [Hemicordylus capensis]|uniref:zinc finger protein 318 isoform X2 n=1 Tax=Hemicordylus capensis TaxID=884348 RepID=UPI002302EBB1|nr:zinc finger protein 318 isoform X2 [Hemicordylus capensis]